MKQRPGATVLIADAEPLRRLAAVDRLEALGRAAATVHVTDRTAAALFGDLARPGAWKIREWAERLAERFRVEPTSGASEAEALADFVGRLDPPRDVRVLVLHEDAQAAAICLDAELPMDFETTRAFLARVGG